jgi:hypothetical protein
LRRSHRAIMSLAVCQQHGQLTFRPRRNVIASAMCLGNYERIDRSSLR